MRPAINITVTVPERVVIVLQYPSDSALMQRLDKVLEILQAVQAKEILMAETLDSILADVTDESTQIDSLTTLMQGLRDQIIAAKGDQTKIDAIFTAVENNKAKVIAAMNAKTPAASVPVT